jgi:hypothetical protein
MRVPRRKVLVEVASGGAESTPQAVEDGIGADRDVAVRSKILSHFIKGKISLTYGNHPDDSRGTGKS